MYKLCSILYVVHINGLYIYYVHTYIYVCVYIERERVYKCTLHIIYVQYVHMVSSSLLDTAVISSVIAIRLSQWE